MNKENPWVEYFDNSPSFHWQFSLFLTKENWQEYILAVDDFFLSRATKYKLLYFIPEITDEYKKQRQIEFFNSTELWVGFLGFQNYFPERFNYVDKLFIDIPIHSSGLFVFEPVCVHQIFRNFKLLEFENEGMHLSDIENLLESETIKISFTIYSSSNIWWEEIEYVEYSQGNINYLEKRQNNRSWAYRITPRLNSFLRDIKAKVEELGGSILLEEYNREYVTQNGILLDGKIIYQEDIDEGRINLAEIDQSGL